MLLKLTRPRAQKLTKRCSERAEDGKSFINPPSDKLSASYDRFAEPITDDRRGGFDVHIYFQEKDEWQSKFAEELWERIRREC